MINTNAGWWLVYVVDECFQKLTLFSFEIQLQYLIYVSDCMYYSKK